VTGLARLLVLDGRKEVEKFSTSDVYYERTNATPAVTIMSRRMSRQPLTKNRHQSEIVKIVNFFIVRKWWRFVKNTSNMQKLRG